MPTQNLDVDANRQLDAASRRFVDTMFLSSKQESLPPVVEQVKQMETQRQKAVELLGEVLATLLPEGNQYLFEHAPEDWHTLVESWRKRYSRLKTIESRLR